jgi:tonB family C-terminal domain
MDDMEGDMIENYGECRAFGLSLLLHFLLFLIAAALGLFSIAAPTGNKAPIDVVLYDAGGDTGSVGGDAAPAAAPAPAVDDIVVQDKTVQPPQEQEQQTRPMQNTAGTASAGTTLGTPGGQGTAGSGSASAGTGSGSGAGTGGGDGGTGLGAASAPPRERVEASLRSEAKPEYPQELIDDDVEGTVTIKILVAADGSVEAVNVESSSGYRAMDQAAIAAGWRFQFNPGDNGRRGVWTKTFHFQLN